MMTGASWALWFDEHLDLMSTWVASRRLNYTFKRPPCKRGRKPQGEADLAAQESWW